MKTSLIELGDIVKIEIMPDGHTVFWTKDGYSACSCGWSDKDDDYVYPDTV